MPGVSIILGNVPPSAEWQQEFTIPEISKYFNIEFSEDHITAQKAYNVGSGLKIPLPVLEGKHLQGAFTKTRAYHEGKLEHDLPQNTDKYWKSLSASPEQTTHSQESASVHMDITQESGGSDTDSALPSGGSDTPYEVLFSCPTEGCIKKVSS